MIDLKKYQQLAVDELLKTTEKLLERDGPGEVCIFQAPTGSGKTVMMAKFIEELARERKDDKFIGGRFHIARREIVVVNWEKIRAQNENGEWANILMRDSEILNFRDA